MRILYVRMKNFKRFTDLIIKNIPDTAKLVVVVGPNGCGKSSLFDAFLQWYRYKVGFGPVGDENYFRKNTDNPFNFEGNIEIRLSGGAEPTRGAFYVRTAYRNDPDFSISSIGRPGSPSENERLSRIIDSDRTVSDNYQRLIYDTMSSVYDSENDNKDVATLREELIGSIRSSMKNVFGDLLLNNISDPLGIGTFMFEKGEIKSYQYKNLSGGEKSAFDVLLDLHIKKKFFPNAIYCIDEIETHLHTKIQGALLRESVKIIPENSQMWITTHSLGVIRAAQEMSVDNPGTVCLIDFDSVDPDSPMEIIPSNLGRVSWEKMLSIALDDFSLRIAPKVAIVCEGSTIGNRRKNFDSEIYNRIFSDHTPEIVFISGGSSNEINGTRISIKDALNNILPRTKVIAMCDMDDKSIDEINEFESNGNIVLKKRNLESYLFSDDVISALVQRENKESLRQACLDLKRSAIENSISRGNPHDDIKSASGEIYVGLKRILSMQNCGNNSDSFMRDTLATLIRPGMETYEILKAAIIDRVSI